MPYVVSGRLREPCLLTPAEFVTLAIREWEIVVGWLASGRALAYGRLSGPGGGTIVVAADSAGEAGCLARTLPFAPYAEIRVTACEPPGVGRELAAALTASPGGGGPAG